jgi:hypothetical protein
MEKRVILYAFQIPLLDIAIFKKKKTKYLIDVTSKLILVLFILTWYSFFVGKESHLFDSRIGIKKNVMI